MSPLHPKSNRRRPWTYDTQPCRQRNDIERLYGRFDRSPRIGTRYDRLNVIFLSGIALALIYDLLPSLRTGLRACLLYFVMM